MSTLTANRFQTLLIPLRHSRGKVLATLLGLIVLAGCGGGEIDAAALLDGTPKVDAQITVSKIGSGTVTSSPAGIDCGAVCDQSFQAGAQVTLSARPDDGFDFIGWSGSSIDCPGNGTCTLTADAEQSISATFSQRNVSTEQRLSVTIAGPGIVTSDVGSINCSSDCSALFGKGTRVTLSAIPNAGQVFAGWSGSGFTCSKAAVCQVNMDSARSITATFTQAPGSKFTLNVSTIGKGSIGSLPAGIACPSVCTTSYTSDTVVTLAASPSAGYAFAGWSGAGCSGTGTCVITMAGARNVTATFSAATNIALNIVLNGSGSVVSSPAGINCGTGCAATFSSGTNVTLTAVPATGYSFTGWTGGSCTGTGTCTVNLTSTTSIAATFTRTTWNVSVTKQGTGTVTSSPSGIACGTTCSAKFVDGTAITLTASPSAGYTFGGWSGGGCSGTSSCTVSVKAAASVKATFTPIPYSLTVTLAGSGAVSSSPAGINCSSTCIGSFNSGSTVTLTAVPAAGYAFSGWGGACSGTATCVVAISASVSVSATFIASGVALTVTKQGLGLVDSAPAGISCGNTCTANFGAGTNITLSATPVAGYNFAGWGGACAGTGACTVSLTQALSVSASFVPVAVIAGAPMVNYTDALSGPTTGGEGNQGAYLSLFGTNFGSASGLGTTTKVYIGDVEVANYRYVGPAKVGAKLGLQQLTVQVGSLGTPAMGQALPIKVVVAGVTSNVSNTFTPNPGRILFVALNGNDSTAAAGDISKPWRTLQTSSRGGAYATLRAGDHIVLRGGNWSDSGFETAWLRFRDAAQKGSLPTGASGTGWIHITAYPGNISGNAIEDVHYSTPASAKGGFHGPASAYAGTTGEYVSISNLRMDVSATASSDAAPINLQYTGGHWRVVNNDLGPWPVGSVSAAKAAGVSGHGNDIKVLGNRIHHIAGTSALENHGIYADTTAQNWEIAYNWIHDVTGGTLVQLYDNEGGAGTAQLPNGAGVWPGFVGMRIHHNWLENSAKYGLNIADAGANTGRVELQAWNNVIIGTSLPPVRMSSSATQMDITFAYNTLHNAMVTNSGSGNGYFRNEWHGEGAARVVRVFDNLLSLGGRTVSGTQWFSDSSGTSSGWSFRNNLYWDNGRGLAAFTLDTARVVADPRFIDATNGNLALGTGSGAIDKALQSVPLTVNTDFTGTIARPMGTANDIGAFEFK